VKVTHEQDQLFPLTHTQYFFPLKTYYW